MAKVATSRSGAQMMREHYFTVEGPNGKAEIYEIVPVNERGSYEPSYEVVYAGKAEPFASEGEAITAAQQLVGAQSVY